MGPLDGEPMSLGAVAHCKFPSLSQKEGVANGVGLSGSAKTELSPSFLSLLLQTHPGLGGPPDRPFGACEQKWALASGPLLFRRSWEASN